MTHDRGYLTQWLAEAQADYTMTVQRLAIAERALQSILSLSQCSIARGLASAALAQDREHQRVLSGDEQRATDAVADVAAADLRGARQ